MNDVSELKSSFQSAMADVVAAQGDESDPDSPTALRAALADPLAAEDGDLDTGLAAIDRKMEAAVGSAASALGSLFNGVTTLVGDGVKDLRELRAVRAATDGLTSVGATLLHQAETMGTAAAGLLVGDGPGGTRGVLGLTFEQGLSEFGGAAGFEALEELSNECSRHCNRTRAVLGDAERAAFDAVLLTTGPLFELKTPVEGEEEEEVSSSLEAPHAGTAEEASWPGLQEGYRPVAALCCGGVDLAKRLAEGLKATQRGPAEGQGDGALSADQPPVNAGATSEHLHAVHRQAAARLAELVSAAVLRILQLAQEVAAGRAVAATSDCEAGGTALKAPEPTARLLRAQARRMAADVEACVAEFLVTLSYGGALAEAAGRREVAGLADGLAGELEVDAVSATVRLQDSLRCCMYVVLRGALPEAAFEADTGAAAEPEGGSEGLEDAAGADDDALGADGVLVGRDDDDGKAGAE